MTVGRKPKPTALHVLNGNPSKLDLDKRQKMEPKPRPNIPQKPSWLIGEGKKMWERLAPELSDLGLLTIVDGETLAAACERWGVYVECVKYLKKHGYTYDYTNKAGATNIIERPQVKIGQKALDQFKTLCIEFGLTPSSRTRIEVEQPNTEDEIDDLLSG